MSHRVVGKAIKTPIVETPLKLVDGLCLLMVSIYQKCLLSVDQFSFTSVSGMSNLGHVIGFDQFFFLPSRAMLGQHEIECDGEALTYWLYDDFVFRHPFFCGMPHCKRGDTLFHRVEVDNIFELKLKGHAPFFEESYI